MDEIKGYLFMILGCIAYGTSTSLFLADNEIIAGGVTGLAVLINYLNENIPIGIISIAINLPILILGIKFQGWKFIFRCLLTVASLGLITGVLQFDAVGTALMLTIFALQDSFGTACNVTGDGALTMILTGYVEKRGIKATEKDMKVNM